MFKLLLCWRYLRTRYIALACIISVTLGVATMIVVNSVMAGFTTEMQDRIHAVLSDVVFEAHGLDGFYNWQWHRDEILKAAGDDIATLTPTVHVPAMLSYEIGGRYITRQVNFVGIDAETYSQVSDCGRYLQHPENRRQLSFDLREGGYDVFDHQGGSEAKPRVGMQYAGWAHRRQIAEREKLMRAALPRPASAEGSQDPFHRVGAAAPPADRAHDERQEARDPFAALDEAAAPQEFDKARQQFTGVVLGIDRKSVV